MAKLGGLKPTTKSTSVKRSKWWVSRVWCSKFGEQHSGNQVAERGDDMSGLGVPFTFLVIVIILIISGIKILKEYERAVVFRLGRMVGVRGPYGQAERQPPVCTLLES